MSWSPRELKRLCWMSFWQTRKKKLLHVACINPEKNGQLGPYGNLIIANCHANNNVQIIAIKWRLRACRLLQGKVLMASRNLAKGGRVFLCMSLCLPFSVLKQKHVSSYDELFTMKVTYLPRHLFLFFCLQHTNETKLGLIRHCSCI